MQTVWVDGLRYLTIARQIEQVERDIQPRQLPEEVCAQLHFAWQSYRLRYFRILRINDLPTEIISNILRFVTVAGDCVHESTLWNAIWFRGSGSKIDRAWTWLDGARQAPLDIRIDGDPSGDDFDDESEMEHATNTSPPLHQAFDHPHVHCRRGGLGERTHGSGSSTNAWSFRCPLFARFELLRGGMKYEDRKSLVWPNVIPQPFLAAPSLAYLSLNDASHSPDAARFREILMNCPRLEKLSMDAAGPIFEKTDHGAHSSCPSSISPHSGRCRFLVVADFSLPYAMFLFFLQLTSAFPKARLLTAYSMQFDTSPLEKATMTRCLDSIPLLPQGSQRRQPIFDLFFRADGHKTPVASHLTVVDCQSIEPHILVE
ncbi:hypothetical protein B0H19DRAFT_1265994 [Mycena capillaripes]|nr:hypothetical protein B0H19DRAFT_1265994 [Mycena capillaripes]